MSRLVTEKINDLYRLLVKVSSLKSLLNEQEFNRKFYKISEALGLAFNFEYCNIGLIEGTDVLKDCGIWTRKELEDNSIQTIEKNKIRNFQETLVGASIKEAIRKRVPYFVWNDESGLDNNKYIATTPQFKNVDFNAVFEVVDNLLLSDNLNNFLVVKISNAEDELIGFMHFMNKTSRIDIPIEEINGILELADFICVLLENIKIHTDIHKDELFVNNLYSVSDINILISKILRYFAKEFNSITSSFLMKARNGFEGDSPVVFLRSIEFFNDFYKNKYFESISKKSEANYHSSLSGRIISNSFEDKEQDKIRFIDLNKDQVEIMWEFIEESKYVIGIPILKSSIKRRKSHNPDENIWGVLCLQTRDDLNNEINRSRIELLTQHIQLNIEKAIYKTRYEQVSKLNKKVKSLEPTPNKDKFYNEMVYIVKDLADSESCSIFFPDEKQQHLFLKATTSEKAKSLLKGNVKPLDIKLLIQNRTPLYTIGNDIDSGITGRVYNSGKNALIYDVESHRFIYKAFYEETVNVHRSIVAIPLRGASGRVIGVLRCINKKKDSIIQNVFVQGDLEIINLISNIAVNAILNNEYQERQYLAMTHFAHESRIPMQAVNDELSTLEFQLKQKLRTIPVGITTTLQNIGMNANILLNNVLTAEYVFLSSLRTKKNNFRKIDLSNLIKQIRKIFYNHRIETFVSKSPSLFVDESQILQVFYNLIINAIRYSRSGSTIQIYYKTCEIINFIGWHEYTIINEGIGVTEDEKELIFTSFYRSENAKRKYQTGSGIGLKVCRDIMDNHDGAIKVTKLNNPTKFSILFKKELSEKPPRKLKTK